MHWQQWTTLIVFEIGFTFNMLISFTRPDKAATFLMACIIMLMYQFVLWSGGWYQ